MALTRPGISISVRRRIVAKQDRVTTVWPGLVGGVFVVLSRIERLSGSPGTIQHGHVHLFDRVLTGLSDIKVKHAYTDPYSYSYYTQLVVIFFLCPLLLFWNLLLLWCMCIEICCLLRYIGYSDRLVIVIYWLEWYIGYSDILVIVICWL